VVLEVLVAMLQRPMAVLTPGMPGLAMPLLAMAATVALPGMPGAPMAAMPRLMAAMPVMSPGKELRALTRAAQPRVEIPMPRLGAGPVL
jgi:hypothetical protein